MHQSCQSCWSHTSGQYTVRLRGGRNVSVCDAFLEVSCRVVSNYSFFRSVRPTSHPLLVPWSRKSRAIPQLPLWAVRLVQNLSACTVQVYLYSTYGPYGLYRASVPVEYSYTFTPHMGRTAYTEPQCLYSTAIPLLPLWAVQPVQYSYTSTPPKGSTACTEPQCLYSRAIPPLLL